ncbi:MAG: peptidoglycan recognition family protein [bacterium]
MKIIPSIKDFMIPDWLWWQWIIIHHSWSKDHDTLDWGGIRRYHCAYRIDAYIVTKAEYNRRLKIKNGKLFQVPWSDIAYHFGVEKVGGHYEILIGGSILEHGAHCKGMNRSSLGICFVGNYDKVEPPEEMLGFAAERLIVPLLKISGYSTDCIVGHRKYAKKSCPGKRFNLDTFQNIVGKFF